jgi:hypothetical protein
MIPLRVQSYVNFGMKTILPKTRFGDKVFQGLYFCMRHGRLPSKKDGFNDTLHRIKSSDEILRPERTFTSCKYLVKDFVSSRIGPQYAAPTLAVLRSKDDVMNYSYPDDCCIKSTHGSGHVVIRRNGEMFDLNRVADWLDVNYYESSREVNYRYLQPGVIIEPLLFDGNPLLDYKVFCVNGEPKMVQVDCDRQTNHSRAIFNIDWKLQDFGIAKPRFQGDIKRPESLDDMVRAAKILSEPFNFVRIDFYAKGGECIVGEITHLHGSTGEKFLTRQGEILANELLFGSSTYETE